MDWKIKVCRGSKRCLECPCYVHRHRITSENVYCTVDKFLHFSFFPLFILFFFVIIIATFKSRKNKKTQLEKEGFKKPSNILESVQSQVKRSQKSKGDYSKEAECRIDKFVSLCCKKRALLNKMINVLITVIA